LAVLATQNFCISKRVLRSRPFRPSHRQNLSDEIGVLDCWVCPLGLSANVPMATGNANESLLALLDGKWVNLCVRYAMGYYAKWMDGRIDDPSAH
jgi:hypothetical protein